MSRRVIAVVVGVVLALGAGVAVASTRSTASGGTNVCVNNTNGLVRVAETCRDSERPLTIGGGSANAQVTQNGTFSVPWGETGTGKVLPLTGVTVSGRCEVFSLLGSEVVNARPQLAAATGETMDVFGSRSSSSPIGVSSILLPPVSSFHGPPPASEANQNAVLTSNGATATVTVGGYVDTTARTCSFLWQAVEAPN
jgi:hypothetical protein